MTAAADKKKPRKAKKPAAKPAAPPPKDGKGRPLNPRQNFLSTVAPRKLTGEVIKSVGLRIASGMTIEGVAALNNISRDAMNFWRRRGRVHTAAIEFAEQVQDGHCAEEDAFSLLRALSVPDDQIAQLLASPPKDSIYAALYRTYETATAKFESERLAIIQNVSVGGQEIKEGKSAPVWQAAAWLLERRLPERYGSRVVTERDAEAEAIAAANARRSMEALESIAKTKREEAAGAKDPPREKR